jgi:uncharacterized membrane protein YbhN (UPF0104 family)
VLLRRRSRRGLLLVRMITTVIVGLFLWMAVRRMDMTGFRRALAGASVTPVVLAAVFAFGMQVARAGYWRAILWPLTSVPLPTMLRYTLAATGASVVLPARGGEALRVWWLHKRHAIPLAAVGAAFALEKMSDVVTLTLVVLPLPWLLPSEPWLGPVRLVTPLVLVAALAVVLLARGGRRRLRWLAALRMFDDLKHAGAAFACVVASWLLDIGVIGFAMHAVAIPVRLDAALLVLLVVNFAIAIPAAPGNIGTLELAATFALTTRGVPQERAAAFALLYHGVQLVPLIVISGFTGALVGREEASAAAGR